jgi:osmotically-inducible protein OsmY
VLARSAGDRKDDIMTTTLTTVDQTLRDSVEQQLTWDPQVDAALVGVTAQDGIVTLTGYVGTYTAKLAAERAARKVFGVRPLPRVAESGPMKLSR